MKVFVQEKSKGNPPSTNRRVINEKELELIDSEKALLSYIAEKEDSGQYILQLRDESSLPVIWRGRLEVVRDKLEVAVEMKKDLNQILDIDTFSHASDNFWITDYKYKVPEELR